MPWLAAALPYITAALGAASAISSSNAQQAQLKSQAQAADMNAQALKEQAGQVRALANQDEEQQRRKARQIMGEQRAAISEAGIGLTSSTGEGIATQSAINAERDALAIRYGGLLEAHGLMAQSAQEKYQADAARSNAKRVKASMWLDTASGALSGYTAGGGTFGKKR